MHLASSSAAVHDGGKELLDLGDVSGPRGGDLDILFIESSVRVFELVGGGSLISDPFRVSIPRSGRSTEGVVVLRISKPDLERVFLGRKLFRKITGIAPEGEVGAGGVGGPPRGEGGPGVILLLVCGTRQQWVPTIDVGLMI